MVIMIFIYVLKLKYGKYYIGKTNNPKFRLESHFNSNGSLWTRKYKPLQVIELISNCDEFDEDKHTKRYMKKYGIENVRGGSYVQLELDEKTEYFLEKELSSSRDACFICGEKGHWARDCPYEEEVWCCEYCGKEFDTENGARFHEIRWCRKNHY